MALPPSERPRYAADPDRYDRTPYRRVGRSGLLLPPISLGLWHNFGDDRPREVQRAMKNLHPIGIPRSILFENLFARTFDSTKLDEDKQRIQVFYQEHGYFMAHVTDATVTMRKTGGTGMHIWLIHPNKPGSRAEIIEPHVGRPEVVTPRPLGRGHDREKTRLLCRAQADRRILESDAGAGRQVEARKGM